jgi:hypothetical protein
MNFRQMQDHVIYMIRGDHDDPALRLMVKRWLNLSRDRFVGLGPWHFLMTTATVGLVANQNEYSLASDLRFLSDQEVRLATTRTRLYPLDDRDFLLVVPNPAAGGTPQYFRTVGAGKIQVYPIPDEDDVAAEVSIAYEYSKRLTTDMDADSDSLGLPEYCDATILDLTEWYARNFSGDLGGQQLLMARTSGDLAKLWAENREILAGKFKDIPASVHFLESELSLRGTSNG